mmetsp:Transcript_555/g.741  ORF Transcript_555/g.741 Transcript_555/m.741 type:complete len:284 (-) Transcript_555:151-1002(-)|eukprot:CAMPEP_0116024940 /NCGR_PEP_ID=MMETSP0321-20121206/12686_1 /TAXON_ID=163516 /ORGANISM="Leptocylindrus danicus var. danicus, Strain B650" /LENGTH=283 /DNA_ID=CAMNT_0003496907 /DNA_START=440 /DNA_END=1291 /DNA_ORIENTATION=-
MSCVRTKQNALVGNGKLNPKIKKAHDEEWMNSTVKWWRQKKIQEQHLSEEKWNDDATDHKTSIVEEEKQGYEREPHNCKNNFNLKTDKIMEQSLMRTCEGKECDTDDEMFSEEEFAPNQDCSPAHAASLFSRRVSNLKVEQDIPNCTTKRILKHLKPNRTKYLDRIHKKKEPEMPRISAEALRAKKKSDEDFRRRRVDLQERLQKVQTSRQESGGVIGATERAQRKVKAKQKALAVVMTTIFGHGKDVWGKAQRSLYFTDEEKAILLSMERSKLKLDELVSRT